MNIRLCEDIFFIYAIHFQGKRTPLDRRGSLNEMKGRQFDSITVFNVLRYQIALHVITLHKFANQHVKKLCGVHHGISNKRKLSTDVCLRYDLCARI